MRTATLHWSRRRTALGIALAVLTALLTTITGTPQASAEGEVVSFVNPTSSTLEEATPAIPVRLTRTDDGPAVQVTVAATLGTAEGADFNLTQVINFSEWEEGDPVQEEDVALTFVNNAIYEGNETFTLNIIATTEGAIDGTKNTHLVTIDDRADRPTVAIADVSILEEPGPMVFTVTRTGATEIPITATATPTSGTADIVNDFASAPGAITIPAGGPGTDTYSIALVADDVYEPDETLNVTLSALTGGVNASGSDLAAVGTIEDNDPMPTLSINDVTAEESNGTATFTITRTGRTAFDTDFDIDTAGGTATVGDDFTGRSDTLTIISGGPSGSATFVVPITDDDIAEGTETYTVTMSDAPEATLLKAVGTGTIVDDDTPGVNINYGDGVVVLEGGAADTVTVALSSRPSHNVTLTPSGAGGQVAVSPSTLTFTPSDWDFPQTLSITAIEDGIDEEDPHSETIEFAAVSDDPAYDGQTFTSLLITVGDADALLVTIDGPQVGVPGEEVEFSAAVNAGGTGTIGYEWAAFYLGNEIATGDEATFRFTPADGGSYNIQVIISDDDGQNPAKFIQFRALSDISSSVFAADILWLAEAGITQGCNPPLNTEFCPTSVVTRGQMAAFLVRFLGLTDDGGGNTFTDDNGSIFESDIAKLATAGITKGCNPPANTQFCPELSVTREQMAAFLVRALELTDDGGGNTFTDDNGSIFEDAIAKLATAGITKGCNPPANTQFCPTSVVTREQMAAFLRRADGVAN